MANVFKVAKQLQRAQPRKYANWQKAVKAAGKKVKQGKRKKTGARAGAVKFIERGETKRTRPKVYRVKRSKTGTFKGVKSIGQAKTARQHMTEARKAFEVQYGNLAVKQMLADTKTKRRKISKKLAALRSQINRLQ